MKIAVFDARDYDHKTFLKTNLKFNHQLTFFEETLNLESIKLLNNHDAVCGFVNTIGNKQILEALAKKGVKVWLQRSMGYDLIDLKSAQKLDIKVFRVPNYSAESVAEHAIALMMSLNRKLILAKKRNQKWNFSLEGLEAKAIVDSTVGVIGSGKIGQCFIKIVSAMGAKVLVYDEYAAKNFPDLASKMNFSFTKLEDLLIKSDFISLHAPLLDSTRHMINQKTINQMKKGVILINCARGELIKIQDLVAGLKKGHIGAAGLDVLERERQRFFFDLSKQKLKLSANDPAWHYLLNNDNVLVTAHQAYFTTLALNQIASITLQNATNFQKGDYSQALTINENGSVKNG